MNITVSQPFPFEIEGLGTIMDYVEDRFLFIVKDEFPGARKKKRCSCKSRWKSLSITVMTSPCSW